MSTVIITPADPIITLVDAKQHLRVDDYERDAQITALIEAATLWTQDRLQLALGPQVLEWRGWSFNGVTLVGPVSEIVSVSYVDRDGADQVVNPADYVLTVERLAAAIGYSWPSVACREDAVRVRYRAGFESNDDSPPVENVPQPIKSAILLQLELLFDRPEASRAEALERSRDDLLALYWRRRG